MLEEDTPIPNGFSPTQRQTADQRVATFQANSNSIYNKYTPFTTYSFGPSQPFVYTKISDSTFLKNLTKYDSQASPIGSTVRDLQRIGKYSVTGNGLKFFSSQRSMQNANAFNETRVYNPLSLLKATAKPGSFGLIDYPIRHMETVELDFFRTAILSTLGIQSCEMEAQSANPIDGTATRDVSDYAGGRGGSRAGKLRLNTAMSADDRFSRTWITTTTGPKNKTFLQNLLDGLIKNLKNNISGTNPRWRSGINGNPDLSWEFRPEYPKGNDGAYHVFLEDKAGLLSTTATNYPKFYNGEIQLNTDYKNNVKVFHKYSPQKQKREDTIVWYASPNKIRIEGLTPDPSTGGIGALQGTTGLKNVYAEYMKTAIESFDINEPNQSRRSIEAYKTLKVTNPDGNETSYPTYKDIPGKGGFGGTFTDKLGASATIEEKNWFSKSKGLKKVPDGYINGVKYITYEDSEDRYNALEVLPGSRGEEPRELTQGRFGELKDQSRDSIFFYFYDLINKIYVPFRATVTGLSDQHSADWETIEYIGRADKLFLYKGFSRDVNLSFTVYANSAKEMLPMWNRINYLVGFTRPSKYTGKAEVTRDTSVEDAETERTREALQLANQVGDDGGIEGAAIRLDELERKYAITGKESRFIYPPMITFRLGDLFYDQPAVMQSVSVTIPDDTNWESLRAEDYSYTFGPTKTINIKGVKSRQLPMKVDVGVQLKLMEKRQALGSDAHYGNASYGTGGTETGRWL